MSHLKPTIILVDTQLAENIGLAARAMYNFGLIDLFLVRPKIEWPSEKAAAVSVDALPIIDNAKCFNSLKEALVGIQYSYAFTARKREMDKKEISNEEAIKKIVLNENQNSNIAIVFGGEQSGLTNDDLSLVSECVSIETDNLFSSLNLSHAVTVFCHSLFAAKNSNLVESSTKKESRAVDHSKLHHFFDHLERELDIRGFFEPVEKKPSMLIKLRNIFHRAELSEREIASLRGVLTSLTKYKGKQED